MADPKGGKGAPAKGGAKGAKDTGTKKDSKSVPTEKSSRGAPSYATPPPTVWSSLRTTSRVCASITTRSSASR